MPIVRDDFTWTGLDGWVYRTGDWLCEDSSCTSSFAYYRTETGTVTPYGQLDYDGWWRSTYNPDTNASGVVARNGRMEGEESIHLFYGLYDAYYSYVGSDPNYPPNQFVLPLDAASPRLRFEMQVTSDQDVSTVDVIIDLAPHTSDPAATDQAYRIWAVTDWKLEVEDDQDAYPAHTVHQEFPSPLPNGAVYWVELDSAGVRFGFDDTLCYEVSAGADYWPSEWGSPTYVVAGQFQVHGTPSENSYIEYAQWDTSGGATSAGDLYNRTWDGSANTIESLVGNGYYSIQAPVDTSNAVVGLTTNLTSDTTTDIEYAIHFRSGTYRILQNGVVRTDFAPFAQGDWFRLVRNEDVVRVLHEGSGAGDLWGIPGDVVYQFAPKRAVEYTLRALFRNVGDSLTGYELTTFQYLDDDGNLRGVDADPGTFYGDASGTLRLIGMASADPYSYSDGLLHLQGSAEVYLRGSSSGSLTLEGWASEGGLFYAAGDLTLTGSAEGGFGEAFRYAIGYLQYYGSASGRPPNDAHVVMALAGLSAFSGYGESHGNLLLAGEAEGAVREDNYLTVSLGTLQFEADVKTTQVQSNALMHTTTRQVYARTVQEWFFAAASYQATHAYELTLRGLAADVPKTFYNPQVEHQDLAEVQGEARTAIRLTLQLLADAADNLSLREALVHWLRASAEDPVEATRHRAAELFLRSHLRDLGVEGVDAISVDDALEAVTSLSLQQQALLMELIEAAAIPQATMHIQVADTLEAEAEDTLATLLHRVAEVEDAAGIWVVLRTDADVIQGWVMNTEGQRPLSQYDNYDFNSLCRIGDRYFGARDDGVYLLEGEDDAGQPIDSAVRSMMLDFGSARQKRVTSAYLGYKSDGKLLLRVRSVDDGQLVENWYEAKQVTAEAPRAGYRTLGRGMRSRYWQFELVNVEGADFELDKLELHPVYLSRRV